MKRLTILLAVPLLLPLAACGDTTGSRALSGGAMGAAGGALIGAIGDNAGLGAAIGGGAGLIGGYLYDQYERGNVDF